MNTLFGKLAEFRNKNCNKENYQYIEDILIKLLVASCNNNSQNTLPRIFCINDIHCTADELQSILKEIGYECSVRLISENKEEQTSCFFVANA